MKMLGSFCLGALAGFFLGATKQGCAMRRDLDDVVKGLIFGESTKGSELEDATRSEEPLKRSPKIKLRKENAGASSDVGSPQEASSMGEAAVLQESDPLDNGPLGIDKATELAEKLGAKVTEIKGEESLPHSHHIDIPINKLSA